MSLNWSGIDRVTPSLGVGSFRGWARVLWRAELTKAAMAAPSREVTAAKETTRRMMMALTQRRKS